MTTAQHDMIDAALEQDVFAALTAALTPAEIGAPAHAGLRERMLAQIADAPPPPSGTATFSPTDSDWQQPAPNVQMKWLRKDEAAGTQEVLIRLGPGSRVPEHSHTKEEHMVILEGELMLGEHPLRQGDVHIAPPGSWHPPITTERGVLILLRCEYPFPAG